MKVGINTTVLVLYLLLSVMIATASATLTKIGPLAGSSG